MKIKLNTSKIIQKIRKRKNLNKKIKRVYPLLKKKDFVYQAITVLKRNKDINIRKVNKKELDKLIKDKSIQITNKLKKKKYEFQPKQHLFKLKKLTNNTQIFTLNDKIVEEMIIGLLEIIYEPIFKKENKDFVFEKKKSVQNIIQNLQYESIQNQWCIKGKVKDEYNFINKKKLIQIIRKNVDDENFLNLIKNAFKCGKLNKKKEINLTTKVRQKVVISPILLNIYMNELDRYVEKEIKTKIKQENRKKNKKIIINLKNFNTISWKIYTKQKEIENYWEFKINKKIKKQKVSELKTLNKERIKVKPIDIQKSILRISYQRYANYWLWTTNGTEVFAKKIKKEMEQWLKEVLGLELLKENTKIVNLQKEQVTFLGYCLGLRYRNKNKINVRKNKKKISPQYQNSRLVMNIDKKRLNNKFKEIGYMNSQGKGKRMAAWSIFQVETIIKKYNLLIKKLINIYKNNVKKYNTIWKYIYILRNSCIHTLANKHKTTFKGIMKKYEKIIIKKEKQKMNICLIDYKKGKQMYQSKSL